MVDFKGLETFQLVAKLGSFRGAAAKLHTTQPAISQRIAQLEATLGIRLLERESRTVTPTARGRELLVYAEKLLGLRAEMLAAIGDRSSVSGVLRLGVAETIVHTWLAVFIKRVNAIYPKVAFEIEVDISPNLRDLLLSQQIDLAFLLGPLTAPSVRNLPLCSHPLGFIASPSITWPDRPLGHADLARWPIVTFSRNTQPYVAVRSLFNRPDLPPVRLHASASLATVIRMALDGMGIAVIPPAIVQEELGSGRLVLLETDVAMPELTFVASRLAQVDVLAVEHISEIAAAVAAEPRV